MHVQHEGTDGVGVGGTGVGVGVGATQMGCPVDSKEQELPTGQAEEAIEEEQRLVVRSQEYITFVFPLQESV